VHGALSNAPQKRGREGVKRSTAAEKKKPSKSAITVENVGEFQQNTLQKERKLSEKEKEKKDAVNATPDSSVKKKT